MYEELNSDVVKQKANITKKYYIYYMYSFYKLNLELYEIIKWVVEYNHPVEYRINFYKEFNKHLKVNKVENYENFWCK